MEFIPYYFAFLIVYLSGLIDTKNRTSALTASRTFLIFASLVVLAAFRSIGVGSDDEAYHEIFTSIGEIPYCKGLFCGYDYSKIPVEVGFYSYLSFLSLFGNSHLLLFLSTASLSVYLNLKSINFYSPYLGASTLIYFSHFFLAKELNAIRTGLATAIVFYATTHLKERKYYLFIALFALSISIHITAALAIIPVILWKLSPNRNQLLSIGILILIISSTFNISSLISPLLIIGFLQDKVELYSNAQEYNYAISLLDAVNIRNITITFTCLIYWDKLCLFNEYFKKSFYFFFSAAFLRIIMGDFAIVAGRSYAAISMFEYIIIPIICISLAGKRLGYALVFLYALITLQLDLHVNTGWTGGVKYLENFL